jgi:hypothetical protein
MPYVKWQEYFPNNPELWRDPPNPMSVEDFETQEEMKWLLDSDLFLNEKEQALLIGDFTFSGIATEEYYFGLDIAGGKDIKKGKKNDSSELSIGRIVGGVKQKIDCYTFQGDAVDQMDAFLNIIHPKYGKYHCKFGLADYGFNPMMVDALAKAGVNIESVQFGARDPNTGKNMKNAMYESFKFEDQSGRFKYPCKEYMNKHKGLKKHFGQWCILEEKRGLGINSKISAPSGQHDDACSADILLNRAMMTQPSKQISKKKPHTFPQTMTGVSIMDGVDRQIEKEMGNDDGNPFNRNNRDPRNGGSNPFGGGPVNL